MNWGVPAGIAATLVAAGVLFLGFYPGGASGRDARPSSPTAIPLAVLGDSMSHSYQDQIAFPPGSDQRGGALRSKTFQWTEALTRLRGRELDLGPWVSWGRPGLVSWGRELVGMEGGRAPRKEDYLYNFAFSGATCTNMMGEGIRQRFHQAPRLVAMMDRAPELWKRGVVVIRIGSNDWYGSTELMDLQARTPDAPQLRDVMDHCVRQIRDTIELIHASHPQTRIMVVGLLNDSDDPLYADRWTSAEETRNLQVALDRFNSALRKLAESVPGGTFFDDSAWFAERWGAHSSPNKPYRNAITIGRTLVVTNTAGDDPHNSVLGDHHTGLAWNALWAQSLVAKLREAYKLPLTPVSDDEVARFVLPLVSPAKAPGS